MYTIDNKTIYQEIIKKSKFITYLHPIATQEEAKLLINKYKEEHNDATHVCYSYILDENTYKYYDDGEPSNSAGMPIYQALKNNKLIYVLCVVVRYYGGVKLGVGGLNHAYSSGALNSIKQVNIISYKKTNNYIIEVTYPMFDSLNYFLEKKGIVIQDKQFLDKIYISVFLDSQELKELTESFAHIDITQI